MQAVIAIPPRQTLQQFGGAEQALMQEVAGVPLLVRIIATAMRGGVDSLLVIWPDDVDSSVWERCAASRPLQGLKSVKLVRSSMFDPRSASSWAAIAKCIEDHFLWLPWNWMTHKRALAGLSPMPVRPWNWDYPTLIEKRVVLYGTRVRVMSGRAVDGVPITSRADVGRAERFLVAHSGKPLDGIYSKFNRLLCRPAVRLLTHTGITPNSVTLGGLVVAIVAALLFARGSYANYVGGALLFFLSGLFDEMDGMLARIKFTESAFGTWFEGFVDNATYLLVFSGITAGLYRQRGPHELIYGLALLTGCLLSFIVIALQRKATTAAERPHEYAGQMNQMLEGDSSNWISLMARQINVFIKKGVAIHYLLIFTVAGGLPLFLRLAAFGSNLTWVLVLYFNRRFFSRQDITGPEKTIKNAA
jgi:phosphatidylglycerophosphate synthase